MELDFEFFERGKKKDLLSFILHDDNLKKKGKNGNEHLQIKPS